MELEINDVKLQVYENGTIERFINNKWKTLKGSISVNKLGYQRNRIEINKKLYTKSRIIYKAFNQNWNIDDISPNNTIDHINRNSLDNCISNLRVANAKEQGINRNFVINQKGYSWNKRDNVWQAKININGKRKYLGSFKTEQEARQTYLNAIK